MVFCFPSLKIRRFNERRIAELEAEKMDGMYRSRAGRLEKWMELVKIAQAELDLPTAPPERITRPGLTKSNSRTSLY